MHDEIKIWLIGVVSGMLILATCLIAANLSPKVIRESLQLEAIQRGHAHYEVNQTNREITFVWNTNCATVVTNK